MTNGIVRTALITAIALLMPMQINNNHSVDEEIRKLNAQEVDALLNHNIKRLEYLWSNDLVVTNPLNQFVNKKNVIELVRSGALAFVSYDRQIEYIRTYNDTVVVTGSETVVWAGKMPNAGKTSQLRFTAVWLRQDGRWQEVARHANIVAQ
jgi:hypothetical protein